MANLTKAQKEDYQKFYVAKGDPGFSPDRNKATIEACIKKHERNLIRKRKDYIEQIRERSDAVASYFRSQAADSGRPIEQYLGKRNLARLRGEQILNTIKTKLFT